MSGAELDALREAVAALLAKHSTESRVRELMATDTGFDELLWAQLAEMGLLGLTIGEQFGGSGAGFAELSVVMEEAGRALMCGPYLSSAVLVPALLAAIGDDDESAAVLPRLAAGSCVATLAFAEGHSALPANSALALDTTAEHVDGGWQLTGAKNYVLDALSAELIYVLAATDSGATSVFAVARDAAGLQATPLTTVDLTRKMARLRLADTPARLVGELGCGATAFASAVQAGSVALLGEQAGGAYRAMEIAVEYARTRFQFGRAIGSFQAVKHMCADMLLEAESAVSAARHVAAAFDADDADRSTDLALAQAYCSDAYVTVAATGIQVHGGIGFTWEHPAHLYLRRARADAQLLGDPATHRERYMQLKGA